MDSEIGLAVSEAAAKHAIVTRYVFDLFAEVMSVPVADLRELEPTDPLDLTSLQNMAIVAELDSEFGDIPVTLLFDRPSPLGVVEYLMAERSADLSGMLLRYQAGL
jgi:hypothetical protein